MIGIDNYVATGSVKSAWITLYILTIILGLLYSVKPLFTDDSDVADVEAGDKQSSGGIMSKIGRAYNLVKDNVLMLLISLSLNGFGAASTRALSIISWIYFALTIVAAIAVMVIDHKFIRAGCNFVFFVLILIETSLAWKQGW
ncbi:hypothetical protein BDF20DRAFT_958869 [Mycotypha africana]|uniref:uncharacterized protein n=1 Tax=Mycotypha africana TaxID=64632 RepID=UPI002301A1B0|nr:uncharacterized protein BDF20DRAFT_958869 [Mycotypha africana]KAI8977582.1 hypothetical protein BDF20DRAFT_958869 [Mycotypha africana]